MCYFLFHSCFFFEVYYYYLSCIDHCTPFGEADRSEFIELHNFLQSSQKAEAEQKLKQQQALLSQPKTPQTGISSIIPTGLLIVYS